MDLQGTITEGNFTRQEINMTGPLTIDGGNWLFARITTNGHALTLSGGNRRGIRVDGEPIDGFVLRTYKPLALALSVIEALSTGGPDALCAWENMVDIVHAETVRMSWVDFKTIYALRYGGLTYSGALLAIVEAATGITGWDNVQDFVANHSKAQLMGEDTELMSEDRGD